MAVSPARKSAQEILLRVHRDGAYAAELLNSPRMDSLSREDRALSYELVMSTLRWQSALDRLIAAHSRQKLEKLDPEVLVALRLGVCQLTRLQRIPAHAAVHESVELVKQAGKRSAAPFVNAVLRKVTSGAKSAAVAEAELSASALALEFAHPEWMAARWIDMYGYSAARAICQADQHAPQSALRLGDGAEAELAASGVELAPGALLTSARRLVAGDLVHCAAFREHRVAVQDEASQLVAALVGRGKRILDCCAAPGGKTSAIAVRNPQAEITAIELHEHRARLLGERVKAANVQVKTGDVTTMEWPAQFDRVLADVPCSGTGTLAANPEIRWRLRPEALRELHDLQVSILRAAARALAPGGRLVYSTCSLEPEEGEAVVEEALRLSGALKVIDCAQLLAEMRRSGELAWHAEPGLTRRGFLRTLPGLHPCDGFFAAVFTK